jgi:hypothetical protein
MADRKKPGVAFWATVAAVIVLVVYPLSFGPVCWINARTSSNEAFIDTTYQPLLRITAHAPHWIKRTVNWYASLGVGPGNGSLLFLDEASGHCHWTYALP